MHFSVRILASVLVFSVRQDASVLVTPIYTTTFKIALHVIFVRENIQIKINLSEITVILLENIEAQLIIVAT